MIKQNLMYAGYKPFFYSVIINSTITERNRVTKSKKLQLRNPRVFYRTDNDPLINDA